MKFRKKPVVIEATQWDGAPKSLGAIALMSSAGTRPVHQVGDELQIATLEGVMTASLGDWIIRGVSGELYPCKPDIFAATYEPAEAA